MLKWISMGMIILTALDQGRGQTVDVQGVVTDRYGSKASIPDAEVTLRKAGLSVRTDAGGRFHLRSVPTGLDRGGGPGNARWLAGRGLIFSQARTGNVSIEILDIQGKSRVQIADSRLEAGVWSYHPSGLADGVYFLHLRTPEARTAIAMVKMGPGKADGQPGFRRLDQAFPSGLAKSSAAVDTLEVRKAGFFETAQAITEYIRNDLAVTLADTTSNQARLQALFASQGTLQPPFDPAIHSYSMAVREAVAELRFTGIAAPARPHLTIKNGSVTVAGSAGLPSDPIALARGLNPIEVGSLSLDSSAQSTYRIEIHRATDSSAALSGLICTPSALSPAFSPAVLTYQVILPQGVTSLIVTPSAQPLAALRVRGNPLASGQASAPLIVRVGTDTILVEVLSPNNMVRATYAIITARPPDDVTAQPTLASLTVSPAGGFSPAFNPSVTSYHAWYPAGPQPLKITAMASNPAFLVTLPGRSAVPGQDSVTLSPGDSGSFSYSFQVASADGSQARTYTLGVSKGSSRISELSSITLSPSAGSITPFIGTPIPNVRYDAIMRARDSVVTVTARPRDTRSTVLFNGIPITHPAGYTLTVAASQVVLLTLESVAQDGVTKSTYTIRFTRYPHVGLPRVEAPAAGLKDSVYMYSIQAPSGCNSSYPRFLMDFGDGTAPVSWTPSSLMTRFLPRAYRAAGTYAIKANAFCNADTTGWTQPISITIYDPATNPMIREISGPRAVSETWHKDTTYLITGKTLFEKGTTLTIQPGTRVVFPDTAQYLMILGDFMAVGTATDSIRFDRANLRFRWKGPTPDSGTYHPDGSYRAGPRMEFCSLPDGYIYIDRTDTDGGWGPYIKDSRIQTITGEIFRYCAWSYFEHCRIDRIDGLRLMKSKIVNSHIAWAEIIADRGTPVSLRKSGFGYIRFRVYDFTDSDISGNTFAAIQITDNTPGRMQGNNILPSAPGTIIAGTANWNMQDNYWGETATTEMDAKGPNQNIGVIHDYRDDVGLGQLDYSGWRSAPVPDAGPDWP